MVLLCSATLQKFREIFVGLQNSFTLTVQWNFIVRLTNCISTRLVVIVSHLESLLNKTISSSDHLICECFSLFIIKLTSFRLLTSSTLKGIHNSILYISKNLYINTFASPVVNERSRWFKRTSSKITMMLSNLFCGSSSLELIHFFLKVWNWCHKSFFLKLGLNDLFLLVNCHILRLL